VTAFYNDNWSKSDTYLKQKDMPYMYYLIVDDKSDPHLKSGQIFRIAPLYAVGKILNTPMVEFVSGPMGAIPLKKGENLPGNILFNGNASFKSKSEIELYPRVFTMTLGYGR
jgi:hypothetical protein